MHAMFVAVMLAVGADQQALVNGQPTVADAQPALVNGQPAAVGSPPPWIGAPGAGGMGVAPGSFSDVLGPYRYDPPRDPQEADDLVHGFFMYCRAWFQPMPQTCYSPHFGCYPGNGRDIYRYPAFHGYYYRQAYNYRPLFEYPWQAGMHEPLPMEISSERSIAGNPAGSQPQHAEVIETPSPNPR